MMKKENFKTCGVLFSSNKSNCIDYFYNNRNNLYIKFVGGNKYRFKSVPNWLIKDFVVAESKGKYFNKFIKGKFECLKLKK